MARRNTIEVVINARDRASNVVANVSGAVTSLGKVALAGAGVAAGAIAGVGAAIGKLAIDAAPVAGIQSAFEGLTESFTGGSEAMLGALTDASAGMITQRDLMTSFNKAAQLVSKDFAQRLPDAMGMLGKVAAATGQDLDYMLDSLVTGVGRLSPMILDNLGIQVDLTAANEEYAESIGKTADELTKQEQQTALMNQVLAKLQENTADMPDVAGSAAAGMAKLAARFQDTKDAIGRAFLPIFQEVLDWIGRAADRFLPVVVDAFEDLAKTLETLIDYFTFAVTEGDFLNDWLTHLPVPIQGIARFLGEAVVAFQQFIGVLTSGQGIFAAIMEFLDNFLPDETIERIWSFYDVLSGAMGVVAQFWNETLLPAFRQLAEWLSVFIPAAIDVLLGFWATMLLPAFERLKTFIQEEVVPRLGMLVDWFKEHIPVAMDALAAFWNEKLKPAFEEIKAFIEEEVVPRFETFVAWLKEKVPEAMDALVGFWNEKLKPAFEEVKKFVEEEVVPRLETFATWLKEKVPQAMQELVKFWEDTLLPAFEEIKKFVDEKLIPAFGDMVKQLGEDIPVATEELTRTWNEDLFPALENVWSFVKEQLLPLWLAWANFMDATLGLVVRVLAGLFKNVLLPVLQEMWDMVKEMILPILDKLAEKMGAEGVGGVMDEVIRTIQTVIDWFNILADTMRDIELPDWLEPGSPSPFEEALRGIADAMREVNSIGLPALGTPGGGFGQAGATTNNNYWNLTIHSGARTEDVVGGFALMKAKALVGAA